MASDHIGKGFSWYDDPEETVDHTEQQPPMTVIRTTPRSTQDSKEKTASEELNDFHTEYNNAVADMYLHPSRDSVEKVMKLNAKSLELSTQATNYFNQVLLENPELNYQASHPVQQDMMHEYDQIKANKEKEAVQSFQQQGYGLFLVYKKSDIGRDKYTQSIQQFSDEFGFQLLGVSDDGFIDENIRENKVNNGKIDSKITPALILVNPKNKTKLIAVHYGATSTKVIMNDMAFIFNGYKKAY